jgi:hypothetical protein
VEIRGTAGEGDQTDISVQGSLPLAALPGWPPAVHHVEGLGVADLKVRGS